MSYNKPASDVECAGMKELARAVGEAWKRAKTRGVQDKVLKKMNGYRMESTTLRMVQYLVDEDDDFQPGDWYTGSKFAKMKNPGSFNKKILEVGRVSGWRWESWKSS